MKMTKLMKYFYIGVLLVGILSSSSCKPSNLYASPANLNVTLTDRIASGDHVGTISWTAVSDAMGAPTSFIVSVALRIGTGTSQVLSGYPKTVAATTLTDTFRYVPSPLVFGQYQYTVEVRQVRRNLQSTPATAVGSIQRDDAAPPAPTNVQINVIVEP